MNIMGCSSCRQQNLFLVVYQKSSGFFLFQKIIKWTFKLFFTKLVLLVFSEEKIYTFSYVEYLHGNWSANIGNCFDVYNVLCFRTKSFVLWENKEAQDGIEWISWHLILCAFRCEQQQSFIWWYVLNYNSTL